MSVSFLTKIKANYMGYLAKGAGAAALGISAYDAHVLAKINADSYSATKDADALSNAYNNTLYSTNGSVTTDAVKKKLFNLETGMNMRNFINSIVGYFGGLANSLVGDAVPVTMGLLAVLSKGFVSKASAVGLAAWAGVSVLKDGFGFGHHNPLNRDF